MSVRAVGLALFALTAGCVAQKRLLTCPGSGGPAWTEVTSKHYVLETNLDADDAKKAMADFEATYALVHDMGFPYDEEPPERLEVVLFEGESEFEQVAAEEDAGNFHQSRSPWDDAPSVMLHGDLTNRTRRVFQHELTHRFVRYYMAHAPVWLNEGLAEYYSTAAIEDGKAWLGREPARDFRPIPNFMTASNPPFESMLYVPAWRAPAVRDLQALSPTAFYGARDERGKSADDDERRQATINYVAAWALVSVLKNGREENRRRFAAYIHALILGKQAGAAWEEAFRGADPKQLEDDFKAFTVRKDTTLLSTAYAPAVTAITSSRTLPDAEVHLLWAKVRLRGPPAQRAGALADIAEAQRLAPDAPETLFWKAGTALHTKTGRAEDGVRDLERAVALRPREPRYLLALASIYHREDVAGRREPRWERLEALEPKLAQVATSARALNHVAWYHALREKTAEGLPLAQKSVLADPGCWECYDTYAVLLHQKGDLEAAVDAQALAVELMPERVHDREVTERLVKFRRDLAVAREAAKQPKPPEPPPP